METEKRIDISKLIALKSPFLYKLIPNFLLKKLKSIVREKEINFILQKLSGKKNLDFVRGGIKELGVASISNGFENLPTNKRAIVVANHPLGGLDGVAMINELGKYRKDIKFLVNDILTELKPFKEYFIPINKHGLNSRENILRLEKLFQSNQCIVLFPAGLVSRKNNEKIEDLEWRKTFISKAKKYNTSIFPVFVEGFNSKKFYKVAYWRQKLRIKINLEMFLLPNEMFLQKGKTIKFTMGQPINPKLFSNSKTDLEWAQLIKKFVYQIKNNANFDFKNYIK